MRRRLARVTGPARTFERECATAIDAARQAGAVLLRHYAGGASGLRTKPDGSPVLDADEEANATIVHALRRAYPDDAILSEEGHDDPGRLQAARVWIVDPLDGTRDFLARTGEFCVHVALALEGRPVVGVVYQPTCDRLATAFEGGAARETSAGRTHTLQVSGTDALSSARIGVSRQSAPVALTERLRAAGANPVPLGASVKFLELAAGALDAVVTVTAGESEWDTCAPELVVHQAGGLVSDTAGAPLSYNQADVKRRRGILASNGRLHEPLLRFLASYPPPG